MLTSNFNIHVNSFEVITSILETNLNKLKTNSYTELIRQQMFLANQESGERGKCRESRKDTMREKKKHIGNANNFHKLLESEVH